MRAAVATLSGSGQEFSSVVDDWLDSANGVGVYCGCGKANFSFSRDKL